jgi:hypothetical protein
MNKPKSAMGALACACAIVMATAIPAYAEKEGASFVYQGGKKTFDRSIEKAAIRRAAEKIGDLRGSLDGIRDTYIVLENELKGARSSRLGFPIIEENRPEDTITTGSVPLG